MVREAAASGLGTVMIKDSCASEGVTDQVDGLLVEENAASLAVCLARIIDHKEAMHEIGRKAEQNLYVSWDTAVMKAAEQYEIVRENFLAGKYRKRRRATDELFSMYASIVDFANRSRNYLASVKDEWQWR